MIESSRTVQTLHQEAWVGVFDTVARRLSWDTTVNLAPFLRAGQGFDPLNGHKLAQEDPIPAMSSKIVARY